MFKIACLSAHTNAVSRSKGGSSSVPSPEEERRDSVLINVSRRETSLSFVYVLSRSVVWSEFARPRVCRS